MSAPLTRGEIKRLEALIAIALSRTHSSGGPVSALDAVREIRFPITNAASQSSLTLIGNNAVIVDSELDITTPYSAGATLSVGNLASPAFLQSASDNNPQLAGRFAVPTDAVWVGPADVLVTVTGAPAAGAGFCVVRYVEVPNP